MSWLIQQILQFLKHGRQRFDRGSHWRCWWSQGSVSYRLSLTAFTCKPGITLIAELYLKYNNVISTCHLGESDWFRSFILTCPSSRGSERLLVLKGLAAVFSHVPMDHCQNLPERRENGAEKRYCLGRPLIERYRSCLLRSKTHWKDYRGEIRSSDYSV